jgi:hypothetical protein
VGLSGHIFVVPRFPSKSGLIHKHIVKHSREAETTATEFRAVGRGQAQDTNILRGVERAVGRGRGEGNF